MKNINVDTIIPDEMIMSNSEEDIIIPNDLEATLLQYCSSGKLNGVIDSVETLGKETLKSNIEVLKARSEEKMHVYRILEDELKRPDILSEEREKIRQQILDYDACNAKEAYEMMQNNNQAAMNTFCAIGAVIVTVGLIGLTAKGIIKPKTLFQMAGKFGKVVI